MNKNIALSNDIRKAVSLWAEFGQRNYYERKGHVIVMNDVTDPENEGLFLARCARRIAKAKGIAYAYEWAEKAFVDNVYNCLQARNREHLTPYQALIATRA